jgi:magnesium transporter
VVNHKVHIRSKIKKIGLPAGSVVYSGEKRTEQVKVSVFQYDNKEYTERDITEIDKKSVKKSHSVMWVNIDGIHDTALIEKIGKMFDIHPLILEDVVTHGQRPKIEDMSDYLYIVLRMIYYNPAKELVNEQVSMILGKGFLITFQETPVDVFGNVRDRIRKSKGTIVKGGADYLLYALVDAIVDNYFIVLEDLGERIEDLEDEMITNPNSKTVKTMYVAKRDIIYLSKSVWPLRSVVHGLSRGDSSLIDDHTRIYIRDVDDHVTQIIDVIETFRALLSEMVEIYLSSVSNKLNEVMKVLTVISTIFIPMSFLASVWGMNFKIMPELDWKYGYLFGWIIMAAAGLYMVRFFKNKRWL